MDDERVAAGKVKQRVTTPEGEQMGTYDPNPALNTIMYEVEFDDGTIRDYGATTIAENLLTQVDDDGYLNTSSKLSWTTRKIQRWQLQRRRRMFKVRMDRNDSVRPLKDGS